MKININSTIYNAKTYYKKRGTMNKTVYFIQYLNSITDKTASSTFYNT